MTTLQEIALEIYKGSDFTDDLNSARYKDIAVCCTELAAEFMEASEKKQADLDRPF